MSRLKLLLTNNSETILKYSLILISLSCLIGSCSYVSSKLGVDEDSWAEEMMEKLIESEIGLEIDLTPNSPED